MVARRLDASSSAGPLTTIGGTFWGSAYPSITTNTDTQREASEAGLEPAANSDGSWTYTLPAIANFTGTKRRLERVWEVDKRSCTHTRGDHVVFDADFTGVLGAAAASGNQWHVLWQLHGPGGSDLNAWRPPPLGLKIQSGRMQLSGGEGHPNNQFTADGYYGWSWDLGPWVDNQRHHLRVEITVGNDPDGRLSVYFNGATICTNWRPQGYWPLSNGGWKPNYPGTIFSTAFDYQGDWVQSRSGLYRGTQNGEASPNYVQWVRWWPRWLSPAHLGSI